MSDQECLVPAENYPFNDSTFDFIRENAWLINDTSKRLDVPVVAVAGSIADEFNTRSKFFSLRGAFDWLQDNAVFTWLPSSAYEAGVKHGSGSKLLNPTRNDVGYANINIATAQQMHQQYSALFPKKLQEWDALVEYILTVEGTILVAALVIKKGQQDSRRTCAVGDPRFRRPCLSRTSSRAPRSSVGTSRRYSCSRPSRARSSPVRAVACIINGSES